MGPSIGKYLVRESYKERETVMMKIEAPLEYQYGATGEGEKFRWRKRSKVSCLECGLIVSELSLKVRMERQNNISVPQTREVEIGGGGGNQ